jgi:hypothetical protein
MSAAGQRTGSNAGQLQSAAAAVGVQWRPASPDVNLVLVSAADWGAVGSSGYSAPADALSVHKPSDKQIKEECELALDTMQSVSWNRWEEVACASVGIAKLCDSFPLHVKHMCWD